MLEMATSTSRTFFSAQRPSASLPLDIVHRRAGRIEQVGLAPVSGLAAAALLRTHLFWLPQHDEPTLADFEDELDLGLTIGVGVVRAKRLRVLIGLCRLAEERECHRAENRRLARASLAVNSENTRRDSVAKVDNTPTRVGPKA